MGKQFDILPHPDFLKTLFIALFASFLVSGCIPEDPVDPPEKVPFEQRVIVEEVMINAPYPRENGDIPKDRKWGRDFECSRRMRVPTSSE